MRILSTKANNSCHDKHSLSIQPSPSTNGTYELLQMKGLAIHTFFKGKSQRLPIFINQMKTENTKYLS